MPNSLKETYLTKGVPGIVSRVDNSFFGRSKIFRPIINKIPPLQALRLITGFDSDINKQGLVNASQELLNVLKFELNFEGTVPLTLSTQLLSSLGGIS